MVDSSSFCIQLNVLGKDLATRDILGITPHDTEDCLIQHEWVKIDRESMLYHDHIENGVTQPQMDTMLDHANCEHHEY